MKLKNKVSLFDFIGVLKFIILIIPAFFVKNILKHKIWLISEHLTARDNGYYFFLFMREKHPEIKTYYAIDYSHPDYKKLKKYEKNLVRWGSFKHYFIYMSSQYNIMSHLNGSPNHPLFVILLRYFNLYNNKIFLQHGIIYNNNNMFYKKEAKVRLFITGAYPEYEFIKNNFGYAKNEVVYTGLARFDDLMINNIKTKEKIILYMPTWRRYFNSKEEFEDSIYYKRIYKLLNNKELSLVLKKNNVKFKFIIHIGLKKYIDSFNSTLDNILIESTDDIDVHEYLKQANMLITDYSSVQSDIAYLNKPVVYYQYDNVEYIKRHVGRDDGYFNFYSDGFGPVIDNEKDLIKYIGIIIERNFKTEEKYLKRINNFFVNKDMKNCERIFDEILKVK